MVPFPNLGSLAELNTVLATADVLDAAPVITATTARPHASATVDA
jgi:hypothetical protein